MNRDLLCHFGNDGVYSAGQNRPSELRGVVMYSARAQVNPILLRRFAADNELENKQREPSVALVHVAEHDLGTFMVRRSRHTVQSDLYKMSRHVNRQKLPEQAPKAVWMLGDELAQPESAITGRRGRT